MFESIGGRKFIMAVLCMLAGVAIELKAANGLSVNMLGLLTALYATFSATNTIITNKQLKVEAESAAELVTPVEPNKHTGSSAEEFFAKEASAPAAPNAEIAELRSQLIPVIQTIGNELVSIKDGQKAQIEAIGTMQQTVGNVQKGISALLSLGR
jgi:hypothetical protein